MIRCGVYVTEGATLADDVALSTYVWSDRQPLRTSGGRGRPIG